MHLSSLHRVDHITSGHNLLRSLVDLGKTVPAFCHHLFIIPSSVYPSFICSSFLHHFILPSSVHHSFICSSFLHQFIISSSFNPSFISLSFLHLFIIPSSFNPSFICSSFLYLFIIPSSVYHFFICSSIHSGHFGSASSSSLLLRSAPDTTLILCWSFTPKRHRQLRVKDLAKVPTWQLEQDSKPRPSS